MKGIKYNDINTTEVTWLSNTSIIKRGANWPTAWEAHPFFSLFWKSRQLRIRQHARAYGFVFERHQRTIFSLRSCTTCARVLSLCMLARSRGAARDGSCSRTRRQRSKVGNLVWAIKSRQTNKHTLLFYRYRRADQGRLRPKIKYEVSSCQ